MEAHERHGDTAAGALHALDHFGDDADLGVFAVAARHQKHAACRSPGSTERVTGMPGKITVSSSGISLKDVMSATIRLLLDDVNY